MNVLCPHPECLVRTSRYRLLFAYRWAGAGAVWTSWRLTSWRLRRRRVWRRQSGGMFGCSGRRPACLSGAGSRTSNRSHIMQLCDARDQLGARALGLVGELARSREDGLDVGGSGLLRPHLRQIHIRQEPRDVRQGPRGSMWEEPWLRVWCSCGPTSARKTFSWSGSADMWSAQNENRLKRLPPW